MKKRINDIGIFIFQGNARSILEPKHVVRSRGLGKRLAGARSWCPISLVLSWKTSEDREGYEFTPHA